MWRTMVALAALTVGIAVAPAAHAASCAPAAHPGGEWRSYGHDLSNSRHQDAEATIGPLEAPALIPAWTFQAGSGDFTGTPAVAEGCVYLGSNTGWVYAINADTGESVWSTHLEAPSTGTFSGGIPSSLAVSGGRVFAAVNVSSAPYLAALDQGTGEPLWSTVLDTGEGANAFASPVPYDGMVVIGVSGASAAGSGSVVFVDEATGAVLAKTQIIPDDDVAQGFGGAGVWSTAAIDADTGYAYVGTGEPFSADLQHPNTNALVKIAADRDRSNFGEIAATYRNNIYEEVPAFASTDPHFDFGASPTLMKDVGGRTLVADLQRAGVFHAVDADTMEAAWTAVVAPTQVLGNAGSPAYDGTAVYGSANPGSAFSLQQDTGLYRWVAPIADGVRYQPMAVANGVVYTVDTKGFLDAYEASTGLPLVHRPLLLGAGTGADPVVSLGAGVAIARNTVYAPVGLGLGLEQVKGYLIAFRPVL